METSDVRAFSLRDSGVRLFDDWVHFLVELSVGLDHFIHFLDNWFGDGVDESVGFIF
jgi:hypothetical protein